MPSKLKTAGFGFIVGSVATLLGVEGSVITVPFFPQKKITDAASKCDGIGLNTAYFSGGIFKLYHYGILHHGASSL